MSRRLIDLFSKYEKTFSEKDFSAIKAAMQDDFCADTEGAAGYAARAGQTEVYNDSLAVLLPNNKTVSCRLCSYRMSGKPRVFYTACTYDNDAFLFLLDADPAHNMDVHPLVNSKVRQQIVAGRITLKLREIEKEKKETARNAAVSRSDRRILSGSVVKKNPDEDVFLTADQNDLLLSAYSSGMILVAGPGAGKTVVTEEILVQSLMECATNPDVVGDHLYFTRGKSLRDDVEAHFNAAPLQPHSFTWEDFLAYLKPLMGPHFPDVSGKPVDNDYLLQWLAENSNFKYIVRNEKGGVDRKTLNVSEFDVTALIAEFFTVIMQPQADFSRPYLSLDDYLQLGENISYISRVDRTAVYFLFEHYLKTIPDDCFEPHLYMFSVFRAIQASRIKPLFRFVLDEVQQMPIWMIACLFAALQNPQEGRWILCGDLRQLVGFQRKKIIEPLEKLLWHFGITQGNYRVAHLEDTHRNSIAVSQFSRALFIAREVLSGSSEKLARCNASTVSQEMGNIACEAIGLDREIIQRKIQLAGSNPSCMVLFPDELRKEIRDVKAYFGLPNMLAYTASGGMGWVDVVVIISLEQVKLLLEISSPAWLSQVEERLQSDNVAFSRKKFDDEKPSLSAIALLDVLHTVSTRSFKTVTILVQAKEIPRVLSLFCDYANTKKLRTKVDVLQNDERMTFCSLDWFASAKNYFESGKREEKEIARGILWSVQIWGGDHEISIGKRVFELINKSFVCDEVAFVEIFSEVLSVFLKENISKDILFSRVIQPDFVSTISSESDLRSALLRIAEESIVKDALHQVSSDSRDSFAALRAEDLSSVEQTDYESQPHSCAAKVKKINDAGDLIENIHASLSNATMTGESIDWIESLNIASTASLQEKIKKAKMIIIVSRRAVNECSNSPQLKKIVRDTFWLLKENCLDKMTVTRVRSKVTIPENYLDLLHACLELAFNYIELQLVAIEGFKVSGNFKKSQQYINDLFLKWGEVANREQDLWKRYKAKWTFLQFELGAVSTYSPSLHDNERYVDQDLFKKSDFFLLLCFNNLLRVKPRDHNFIDIIRFSLSKANDALDYVNDKRSFFSVVIALYFILSNYSAYKDAKCLAFQESIEGDMAEVIKKIEIHPRAGEFWPGCQPDLSSHPSFLRALACLTFSSHKPGGVSDYEAYIQLARALIKTGVSDSRELLYKVRSKRLSDEFNLLEFKKYQQFLSDAEIVCFSSFYFYSKIILLATLLATNFLNIFFRGSKFQIKMNFIDIISFWIPLVLSPLALFRGFSNPEVAQSSSTVAFFKFFDRKAKVCERFSPEDMPDVRLV